MLRWISAFASLVVTMLLVTTVMAGKPERDKKKELEPKIKDAIAEAKAACGCDFAIDVKWDTYTKADDMFRILEGVTSFTEAEKEVCQSQEDKDAFCKGSKGMKGQVIFQKEPKFEKKDKLLICGSSDSSYCGSHQVKPVFDAF